jgi:hypothetical protein
MAKQAGNTMRVLRWIFGIPLAFAITGGVLMLIAWQGNLEVYFHNYYVYMAITEFEIAFTFALPVFLSSLFAPSPKKYAALIGVVILTAFIAFVLYYTFISSPEEFLNSFTVSNIGAYVGFFAGGSIGFGVSFAVFKNKGWNRDLTAPEMPEDY